VGPVTVASVRERYGWDEVWIESRLREWAQKGRLVRGRFRPDLEGEQWVSRKLAEVARRRALAALRKQIEAVDVERFAAFLHRWQHVDPRDRLDGPAGVRTVLEQLYGIPRYTGCGGWERDYLPARVNDYDPAWLSEVLASGDIVWAAQPRERTESGNRPLSRVLFFQRGTGSDLAARPRDHRSERGRDAVRDAIAREGASFFADIQAATGLTTFRVRDALRELVAAGLVTNDTAEALREVIRWKPVRQEVERDPAEWLPADFTPSADRKTYSRRPNIRRLPKWRRPDLPGAQRSGWVGRWSLVHRAGVMGPKMPEDEHARVVARQWLDRYGVVFREWWKRERPPVGWRTIYRELKRMELRGEVRRGYFVSGLSGAQFAVPEAVERLRSSFPVAQAPASRVAWDGHVLT
jgi:ATP-dependent helicase Lhr and Lhr-like helicase